MILITLLRRRCSGNSTKNSPEVPIAYSDIYNISVDKNQSLIKNASSNIKFKHSNDNINSKNLEKSIGSYKIKPRLKTKHLKT
jgi:hypothetical protein